MIAIPKFKASGILFHITTITASLHWCLPSHGSTIWTWLDICVKLWKILHVYHKMHMTWSLACHVTGVHLTIDAAIPIMHLAADLFKRVSMCHPGICQLAASLALWSSIAAGKCALSRVDW